MRSPVNTANGHILKSQTSGEFRPSDKGGGGGGGCHPDPEIRGGDRSPKKFFSALILVEK